MNYMRSAIKRNSLQITTSNALTGTVAGTQSSAVLTLPAPINLSQYKLLPVSLELPQFSGTPAVVGTAALMGLVNGSWVALITATFSNPAPGTMIVVSSSITIPTTGILTALQNVLTISSASGGGSLTVNWANTLYFQLGQQNSVQTAA